MTSEKKPRVEFPAWAAPGLGALLGGFIAYCTLLQNEPLSPWPPLPTIGLGVVIGTIAGGLLALHERMQR